MIAPRRKDWKGWERAVRRKIRESKELRRAYKAQRSNRKQKQGLHRFRFLAPVVLLVMIFGVQLPTSHVLNLLLLWTCFVTATRAQQLVFAFRNHEVLGLVFGWPVSDDHVFHEHRRQVTRLSCWLIADWLVFGFAIAVREGDVVMALLTPLFAVAQWAGSFALALWAVRWFPRFPYAWLVAPAGILLLLVGQTGRDNGSFTPLIEWLWRMIYVVTPAGWIGQIWLNVSDGDALGYALLFVAMGLSVLAFDKGWKATRAGFDLNKLFGYEESPSESENRFANVGSSAAGAAGSAGDYTANAAANFPEDANSKNARPASSFSKVEPVTLAPLVTPPDLAELARDCRVMAEHIFATPPGGTLRNRGVIEQTLGWFLTQRERVVIDFLLPAGQAWGRRWAIASLLLVATAITAYFGGGGGGIVTVLGAAVCIVALPVFGRRWFGLEAVRTFQTQVGICAYVPLSFWEIARVVLKLNFLHCVAGLPFIVLTLTVGFAPENADFPWLCDHSFRVFLIVVAAQPIWLVAKFSPNTNDSSGNWFYVGGLMLFVVFLAILLVSLMTTGVMAETTWISMACLGGIVAITHGFLAVYGFALNRGWFDMLGKQK